MIYFFDGSKQAFLTAFLTAYRDGDAFLTSTSQQLALGQQSVFVVADAMRASRAEARLRSFDPRCMKDLDLLLRSGDKGHEQVAFRYFRLLATRKVPVRNMYAEDEVMQATEYLRRVSQEIHHLHGFVHFMECASGALYAPVSPDHDICDLLAPHFRARLPGFSFVIHDVARQKAAVCDGTNLFVAPLAGADVLLKADEGDWQTLWRRYYSAVNIPSRKRSKQMRSYLPVRYWKFMPELNRPDPEDD